MQERQGPGGRRAQHWLCKLLVHRPERRGRRRDGQPRRDAGPRHCDVRQELLPGVGRDHDGLRRGGVPEQRRQPALVPERVVLRRHAQVLAAVVVVGLLPRHDARVQLRGVRRDQLVPAPRARRVRREWAAGQDAARELPPELGQLARGYHNDGKDASTRCRPAGTARWTWPSNSRRTRGHAADCRRPDPAYERCFYGGSPCTSEWDMCGTASRSATSTCASAPSSSTRSALGRR